MSDSATPWTAGCQAPLSMGFFKQEYWRCHYRLQGDLPDSGIEPASPVPSALAGRLFATKSSGKHAKYWISVSYYYYKGENVKDITAVNKGTSIFKSICWCPKSIAKPWTEAGCAAAASGPRAPSHTGAPLHFSSQTVLLRNGHGRHPSQGSVQSRLMA